jgi:hypothetical protein
MWRERRPGHIRQSLSLFDNAPTYPMSAIIMPGAGGRDHVPQRLQSVCVLLWRFPKLEVPFAVSRSVSKFVLVVRVGARRTHCGLGTVRRVMVSSWS